MPCVFSSSLRTQLTWSHRHFMVKMIGSLNPSTSPPCASQSSLLLSILTRFRWYKPPPKNQTFAPAPTSKPAPSQPTPAPENSAPLNFDTFVPSHDPTLSLTEPSDLAGDALAAPPGPMVSQDEAFKRALGAMYWTGYWTAMYHVRDALFICECY